MFAQHQTFKLQIQPWEVSGSNLSLSKDKFITFGINFLKVTTDVTSNINPHSSQIWTQTWFLKFISCDLEPDTTKPTYQKIVISADLSPDMSAGFGSDMYISRILLNHILFWNFLWGITNLWAWNFNHHIYILEDCHLGWYVSWYISPFRSWEDNVSNLAQPTSLWKIFQWFWGIFWGKKPEPSTVNT